MLLLTATACLRLDNAPPADEVVEAALGEECLPAAEASVRASAAGVVTTGDLIGFEVRAAYLGRNPFELQSGSGIKRLTDSLMRNDGEKVGIAVWPVDLRLAVLQGSETTGDTVSFRCFALDDGFGELRVIQREPDRSGSWLTQLFSQVSGRFR